MNRIGVDLGGTNIKVGLVNESGEILSRMQTPTMAERPSFEIVKDIAELIKKLIAENKIDISEIAGIGIGIPGTIDTKKGTVEFANNFANFRDVNIKAMMMEHFKGVKISIENDANSAALGESVAGASKGYRNSIMMTIGTGVGAGIIINGSIYGGLSNGAGEIGHMLIKTDGEMCTCGRKGCFERYASAAALVRRAVKAAKHHDDCLMNELCDGDTDRIDGRILFTAYRSGDKYAVTIINDFIEDLANGLVNIIYIFDPEIIVIGGGMSAAVGDLMPDILGKISTMVRYNKTFKTKIRIAELKNDAGIIGAAFL